MKSQKDRLLEYLKYHGAITQFDAWYMLGISRLGARIWDLKRDGINIKSQLIPVKNRFGEVCRVAQYNLIEYLEEKINVKR